MASTALCDICGTAPALYSCMLCGRRVCGNCITVRGACKDCIGGRKMDESKKAEELTDKFLK